MSGPEPLRGPDDPRLAPLLALRARPQRPCAEWVLAEGVIAAEQMVACGLEAVVALVTPAAAERVARWWPPAAPLLVAERAAIGALLGYDMHRGCVAAARRPGLGAIAWERVGPRGVVVAAEGLADPVNVGALARTCRALAADLLLLDSAGADPFAPRAVRSSLGHVFGQPLAVPPELGAALDEARARLGVEVLAAVAAADATPLPALEPPRGPRLLLLGHEGRGLSPALLARADRRVTVPMAAGVDSLNVAAAAAVLLYGLRLADRS